MLCALSSTTPEEPVIAKTGYVYERRLIEKYIDANGKCPASGEPLSSSDLIPIKVNKTVKPRPAAATSIPGMLALFQSEWDSLMLETYNLKQHLDTVRQELAHALYQQDAACRVIARLIKERDSARSNLASLQGRAAPSSSSSSSDSMEVDSNTTNNNNTLSEAVKNKIASNSSQLTKERKKRTQSQTLASSESVKSYTPVHSYPGLHKAASPGVTTVNVHPSSSSSLVATGGVDGNVVVFDRSAEKVVSTLTGHAKRVNDVVFHPTAPIIFSASQDKSARSWICDGDSEWKSGFVFTGHSDEIIGVSVHSTGDYIATAAADQTWALWDIHNGQRLVTVPSSTNTPYTSISFHPDGLILGTGTKDKIVRVWDVRTLTNAATIEGHHGSVDSLSFSENGYHLASAGGDEVKLWDLRNLKNFHTIALTEVASVSFDYSGAFLSVAHANSVSVYGGKAFPHIQTWTDHTARVTDVCFGPDAKFLASSSLDRSFKIFTQPE
eukprot:TRINITY_DN1366_c0_g1_i1.p1 TRINITY_DN1366_c0_g1~~TRINITY_DN1366_c0_g1_i1.p1  ORF type:complete len:497 (-),score=186.88 TRINITY_DN1366_c0_g1_i1:32-1522(-)